jgi:hypothetical protein
MNRVTAGGAVLAALLLGGPALAQSQSRPVAKKATALPRTPWGHPDLQGVWTNSTTTPLERPASMAERATLTDEEFARLAAQAASPEDGPPRAGDPGTYNAFWLDKGGPTRQTSLITNPTNGRLPPLLPAAAAEQKAVATIRTNPPSGPEDTSLSERCVTRGMPAAMIPGYYNHNYQIVQTKDYVVLLVEMIHDMRVIPLDGRPHLPSNVSQWLGDPRGHWEGDTLVVETTNVREIKELRPSHTVFGGSANTRVVERFRRIDADNMEYQFTVTDPQTFTAPWTASTPMHREAFPIFEYACHEGNHALPNMLRGARKQEADAREKTK